MSSALDSKKRELKLRKQQIAILEEEIRLLSLKEGTPRTPTLQERFPKHSTVRLTGKSEKYRLKGKKAKVTGYTNCYVRLERKGESFLRAPENITKTENVE